MKIGILEAVTMPDSLQRYGSFVDLFANLLDAEKEGYELERYFVIDEEFPSSVSSCEAYLITGSTHDAYADIPWINTLKQLVRDIHASGRPLIGVCFGHQLIAEALGGKVEKYIGGWGVGRHQYEFHQTPVGPRCEQNSLTMNAFHQDQIIRLPAGAEVFASSEFCQYAGVAYGNNTLSVQAHPEFTIEFETDLTADKVAAVVPQHVRDKALADLRSSGAQVDNAIVSRIMKDLLNTARTRSCKSPSLPLKR